MEYEETYETLNARVFTPRWGHIDNYSLTRTDKGWHTNRRGPIDNLACPDGSPAWYGELNNDSIIWSSSTPFFIEELWQALHDELITADLAQEALQRHCNFLSGINELDDGAFHNSPADWAEEVWEDLSEKFPGNL